jgi:hypothetical protein
MFENTTYILFVLEALLISHLCTRHGVFNSVLSFFQSRVKSKRLLMFIASAISGVLPVPGRIVLGASGFSAAFKAEPKKLGLVNYISTHHYYLWSPLEKTVIIPMAAFGISYTAWLGMFWPFILVTAILVAAYVFFGFTEDQIELNITPTTNKFSVIHVLPLLAAIVGLIVGLNEAALFGAALLYYFVLTREKPTLTFLKNAVDYRILVLVLVAMGISQFTGSIPAEIKAFVKTTSSSMDTLSGFMTITGILFAASFALGSSGKFAAITTAATAIFGIQWLPYFFMIEFFGYNVSPAHKCVVVNTTHFHVPLRSMLLQAAVWNLSLIALALALKYL